MTDRSGREGPPSVVPQIDILRPNIEKNPPTLIDMLREGMFMLLERHKADHPWSAEKVARDILQNFFDANDQTMEGIHINVTEQDGFARVYIEGDKQYPYNRLVAFGAGHKEDTGRSAGGKHEGSKIANLSLLRDFGCREVEYGSGRWILTFYLDDPPAGMVDPDMTDQQGMYVKITELEEGHEIAGNYIDFKTDSTEMAEQMVKARDLFYHPENEDFKDPDIDMDSAGCQFLGKDKKGNFYLNGQRINFEDREAWQTLPGFTMWSKKIPSYKDREIKLGGDRSVVTTGDIREIFVPFMVEQMTQEELIFSLEMLEDYYERGFVSGLDIGKRFLSEVVRALAQSGYRHEFLSNYIANDEEYAAASRYVGLGYTVCEEYLGNIGMRRVSESRAELERIYEIEPNKEETERIRVLLDLMRSFIDLHKEKYAGKPRKEMGIYDDVEPYDFRNFEVGDLRLFVSEHPILGMYQGDIWMSRMVIRNDAFSGAVRTYLHEICHRYGDDESATFSDALTSVVGEWTEYLSDNVDAYLAARDAWLEVSISDSIADRKERLPGELSEYLSQYDIADHDMKVTEDRYWTWSETDVKLDLSRLGEKLYGGLALRAAQYIELFDRVKEDPVVRCLERIMYDTSGVIGDEKEGNAQLVLLKKQEIAGVRQDIRQIRVEISALERKWQKKGKPKKLKPKDQALFDRIAELQELEGQYEAELEVLEMTEFTLDDWSRIATRARSRVVGGVQINAEAMSSATTFVVVTLRELRANYESGAFDDGVDISAEYTTLLQALYEKNNMLETAFKWVLRRELRYAEADITAGDATDAEEVYADTILQFLKEHFD